MSYGQYSYEHLENGPEVALQVSRKVRATRQRTVFPSHELPHLWAHQSAPLGRCSSSMSFDGPDFYSYGTIIGSIAKTKNGRTVYLVSDGTYSVTTSKHQGDMRRAIPSDALRFTIPGASRGYNSRDFTDATRIMDAWRKEIQVLLEDAGSSRRPKSGRLVTEAAAVAQQMRNYAKLMGVKTGRIPRIPTTPEALAKFVELASKKAAADAKLEAARKAALQKQRIAAWMLAHPTYAARWDGTDDNATALAEEYRDAENARIVAERRARDLANVTAWMSEHTDVSAYWDGSLDNGQVLRGQWEADNRERLAAERLAAWLDGKSESSYGLPYNTATMLRVVGDAIETSKGASFPIAHAVRGLALVRSVMKRGEEWRTNGHTCHLGHYQIDRITADGTVYAGCHQVPWTSIERIAPALDAYRTGAASV